MCVIHPPLTQKQGELSGQLFLRIRPKIQKNSVAFIASNLLLGHQSLSEGACSIHSISLIKETITDFGVFLACGPNSVSLQLSWVRNLSVKKSSSVLNLPVLQKPSSS